MCRFELCEAIRLGIADVGGGVSHCRSSVPAWMSVYWVSLDSVPSLTTIWLRYWCRIGSVDCFQAGFLVSTNFFSGMYCEIWYGPSESVCCLNWALSGR